MAGTGDSPPSGQRSPEDHDLQIPSSRPLPPHQSISRPISPSTFYGSSRTTYIPPEVSPIRDPELVPDEYPVPDLARTDDYAAWGPLTWDDAGPTHWDNVDTSWAGGNWSDATTARKIAIQGRDENEELRWFDTTLREKSARPGPGMLPPMISDLFHEPEHALYSVSVPQPPSTTSPFSPSSDDVRTAVPHPNAYYCREHNGWVLILWRSSTVLPPLIRSPDPPLPDLARRKLTNCCVGEGEQPFGQANVTHHWHRYERAVDARKLNTPFMHGEVLLDLYVCCQCSTYALASGVLPGVIPASLANEFTSEKLAHPTLDKTAKATVLSGWETVLTIIENRLWKDETRGLPVTRPRFQSKVGWNSIVERVFSILGFNVQLLSVPHGNELTLQPPPIDPSTSEGKASRSKLLRAWIEISAWLAIFEKSKDGIGGYSPQVLHVNVDGARDMYQTAVGAHVNQIPRGLLPTTLLAYEALYHSWTALGMTPNTYSWETLAFAYLAQCRCDPANTMIYFQHLYDIVAAMMELGEGASPELQTLIVEERGRGRYTVEDLKAAVALLGFGRGGSLGVELDGEVDDEFVRRAWRDARQRAWREPGGGSQTRRDLADALRIVANDRGSEPLLQTWKEEQAMGMAPDTAYSTLEVPKDVEDGVLVTVFLVRVDDQPSQAEKMREALSVIAEVRDSERLRQFLLTGRDSGDTSSQATSPDTPRGLNQLGNTCYLNSLLQYFYTIKDLREAITSLSNVDVKALDDSKFTDDDLKRHRVGGRLVTRREIQRSKQFVHHLASLFWNLEFCEDPAITPEKELAQLALLTSQDEDDDFDKAGTDSSNDTDATLVDDAPARSAFDRSPSPVQSPSSSVLGKRTRDVVCSMDTDDSFTPEQGPAAAGSNSRTSSPAVADIAPEAVASSSKLPASHSIDDVEMTDESPDAPIASKAPPLPPRKPMKTDDNTMMMFGRQHDVSECMDNCMFQIETALLDFEEMAGVEEDKTSVVKRLFYGKKRQRLTPLAPEDATLHQSSVHDKEDLFSHLHVNVADEGYDLYDALARYFDDVVELEGQKKRMEVSLIDLPPLLQIQLQRAQFNRETQQAYKSQAYVRFGETIYMDRFLDSADPEKQSFSKAIQAELTASRDRIQRLTQGKHAPFALALGNVSNFLSKQSSANLPEADDNFVATICKEQEFVTTQLRQEREKAVQLKQKLDDIWKDDTKAGYDLTSVFIHRGSSPSYGHYFFYSRNLPDHPDSWFKYNDSDVTAVSKDEVLADTTGSTANPYLLVFVRKGCEAIDTVHRFDPATLQDG